MPKTTPKDNGWVSDRGSVTFMPKKPGDHRRHVDNNRDGGERFHHPVQIVGDDRGKGIHHAGKDLGGDAGHLDGLLVLGEHIFEQVLILFVIVEDLRALDAFHHHFVGAQGGGKVGQAFLIFEQFQHFAVAGGFLQLVFDRLGDAVDLAQVCQIARGGFEEDIQRKAIALAGLEQTIFSICQDLEHVLLVTANGDDDVALDHDAKRNGDKGNIAIRAGSVECESG